MGIKESFKRGAMEMLILCLLSREDMYGYQLAQEINSRSDGRLKITEGSMYPHLYKLIEKGAISDSKRLIGKRRTRVYYHLEESGKQLLEKYQSEFLEINDGIMRIIESFNNDFNAPPMRPPIHQMRTVIDD